MREQFTPENKADGCLISRLNIIMFGLSVLVETLPKPAMKITAQPFTVHKRFALTISRGTTAQTTNVWVEIEQDGIVGWGEASPFSVGEAPQTTEVIVAQLQAVVPALAPVTPWEQQRIEQILATHHLVSAARTAIDIALHDWRGKCLGLPLWKLWGLNVQTEGATCHLLNSPATSVTIGISSPEAAQKRLLDWLTVTEVKAVKVKLGSPDGIEADRTLLKAVLEVTPAAAKVSIDANGGWQLDDAIALSHWLADQGITYIEQPLPRGQEADLPVLHERSPLPIFVDESCWTSADIPKLRDRVHGINIKLMKSGGLTEALRMVHTAQACGLEVMLGCYSDSSLANTAAAHLIPFATHVDLDSHLNLLDDPFIGAQIHQGGLTLSDRPGLGCVMNSKFKIQNSKG
jgi:L-Ala-D/L-Glu epimerase